MSITSKLFLDDRHTKKDGTRTIKLRITIHRKSFELSMKRSIPKSFWDDRQQRVKPRCPGIENTTRFNHSLQKKMGVMLDKIMALEDSGSLKGMDLKQIKSVSVRPTPYCPYRPFSISSPIKINV